MPVPDAAEKRPANGNVLLAGALLAGISGVILQYFMSLRVTEAYMDEEFHVRQTSLYCGNNFRSVVRFPFCYPLMSHL